MFCNVGELDDKYHDKKEYEVGCLVCHFFSFLNNFVEAFFCWGQAHTNPRASRYTNHFIPELIARALPPWL